MLILTSGKENDESGTVERINNNFIGHLLNSVSICYQVKLR